MKSALQNINPSARDVQMMQRCIHLARLGWGRTGANPLVGCVIARDNEVLVEGYHQQFGGNHAEVEALSRILPGTDLSNAIMYVNLEPCCHQGKTPPCTNAIMSSGIRKVVIGCSDPNPLVAGAGASRLRESGIEVVMGVLEDESARLNHRFFVNQKEKRPYVILKWAQTFDGFMDKIRAVGEMGQFPISGRTAAHFVHRWRADSAAVLVGRMTAENDDPQLSVRHVDGPQPAKIVWDSNLKLSPSLQLFSSDSKIIVLNKHKEEMQGNITWLRIDVGANELLLAMNKLYEMGLYSILVEGGSKTLHHFLEAGLWDEARVFTSSLKIGNGLIAPSLKLPPTQTFQVGRDILQYFHKV